MMQHRNITIIKCKKLISLQYRVRASKPHIQNGRNHFARIVIERIDCPYKPTSLHPILLCDSIIIPRINLYSLVFAVCEYDMYNQCTKLHVCTTV